MSIAKIVNATTGEVVLDESGDEMSYNTRPSEKIRKQLLKNEIDMARLFKQYVYKLNGYGKTAMYKIIYT